MTLIISLSSIPPRFPMIGPTLESLLAQSLRADRIEVNIPHSYARFPDWDGCLPEVPTGVDIVRCDADLGPATKILPTARRYRGQEAEILFCDDDRIYPAHWAARFLQERKSQGGALAIRGMMVHWKIGGDCVAPAPQAQPRAGWVKSLERVVSGQEDRLFSASGHVDMFEGCGGVMVRPDMFDDADIEIPDVARPVDDVWLSGMLARKGIPIWLIANERSPRRTDAHGAEPLDDAGRHDQNIAAIRYLQDTFGIWQP